MAKRRGGLSGWVGRLRPWHQLLAFLGALAVAVTAFNYGIGWVGGIERDNGILARWLGWAPRPFVQATIQASETKVLRRMDTIDLRLIYSEIRRLQREQERLRTLPSEKPRLEDVTTELADTIADYQAIKRRLKDGGG